MPHLYFTLTDDEMKFNYDLKHATEFLTFLFEIRGEINVLHCVVLTQKHNFVHISVISSFVEAKIPVASITKCSHILSEKHSVLIRNLRKHLHMTEDRLEWIETQSYYAQKEKGSKLLNTSYLTNLFNIAWFKCIASQKILGCYVEIHKFKDLGKIRIYKYGKWHEFPSHTKEFRW